MDKATTLWKAVKAYAEVYAASDRPLPVDEECRRWLSAIIHRTLGFSDVPPDAFDFYANELCRMVTEKRAEQTEEAM